MRKMWMLLVGSALLAACEPLDSQQPMTVSASAFVNVIDGAGRPFRADTVAWYYPPGGDRYDGEHPAQCINTACTLWAVPAEVSGPAYVSATWRQPIPGNASCWYLAFAASPLTASVDAPPTVTLRLNKQEVCA